MMSRPSRAWESLFCCRWWAIGPAGWNSFTNQTSAYAFADQLLEAVHKYGLDGIDIDDEYSKGQSRLDSMIMVTSRLREQMPSLIISKALQDSDHEYFKHSWNGRTLAGQLTYGWDMMYRHVGNDGLWRLGPYTSEPPEPRMRMKPHQLGLGVWHCPEEEPNQNATPAKYVAPQATGVKKQDYGGMMVFGVEDLRRAL